MKTKAKKAAERRSPHSEKRTRANPGDKRITANYVIMPMKVLEKPEPIRKKIR